MVHAVLERHAPGVARIDVTHRIPPHDVRAGALTLWRAVPWLVPGVILGVVDPGVGTQRRAVAIEVASRGAVLVGPDNGLLLPAALHLGPITAAVELPPPPNAPGATFAGRDVFAPAAARAAAGVAVADLGQPIDPETLAGEAVPEPTMAGSSVEAEVLWVDRYGNAQLNATPAHTGPGPLRVETGREPAGTMRVVASYDAIGPDDLALVVDSYGYLAICAHRRPAAARLGVGPGDQVRLSRIEPAHR